MEQVEFDFTIDDIKSRFSNSKSFARGYISQKDLEIFTSNNIGLYSVCYSVCREMAPIYTMDTPLEKIKKYKKDRKIVGYFTSEKIIKDKTFDIVLNAIGEQNKKMVMKILKISLIKNQIIKPNEKIYFTAEGIIPWHEVKN